MSGSSLSPRVTWALAGVLIAAAGALRELAAQGDFWLDEIVSWLLVSRQASLWSILTEFRQETNHVLASWTMFLLGRDAAVWQYRLPAVLCGTATVVVAGLWGLRRGQVTALTAMLLIGSSYFLIHYSSEARGYAYLMLLALLSLYVLEAAVERRSLSWGLVFPLVASAGCLAHLAYLSCYAALLGWSLYRMVKDQRRPRHAALHLLLWHSPPLLFLSWFYWINVRHMTSASGPLLNLSDVLAETLSLAQGGPADTPLAYIFAAVSLLVLLLGLRMLRGAGSDLWVFFALAIAVVPSAALLALRRPEIYPRYFLVSVLFLLLLESQVLARLAERGRWGRLAYALLIAAFLGGNLWHVARLIRLGRDQVGAALQLIVDETDAPIATLSSDHDERHLVVLAFHQARRRVTKELVYYRKGEWPAGGPEWLLVHSLELDPDLPRDFTSPQGAKYLLVREFPDPGLSSWHEAVYRRVAAE